MTIKLLIGHHLEFLSLLGGCTGSTVSMHVKMPHCWKSHVTAQLMADYTKLTPDLIHFYQDLRIILKKKFVGITLHHHSTPVT